MNVAQELSEIRARVTARLSRTVPEIPELALPPLAPLRQARGVAEGWASGIGVVNPRPPGFVNGIAQWGKEWMARALRWFAFPQVQFNSGTVAALVRSEEMFADINRNMVVLGQNLVDRQRADAELLRRIEESEAGSQFVLDVMRRQLDQFDSRIGALEHGMEELRASLLASMRASNESTEASLAEMSRSINAAFDQTSRSVSSTFDDVRQNIARVEGTVNQVQDRFWDDFGRYRQELESQVRLVRQRLHALSSTQSPLVAPGAAAAQQLAAPSTFDYSHFEQRFRGKEELIRLRQSFYLPLLRDNAPVLDVASGRGEMLELLREQGIEASGVDLDPDMIERCNAKNLPVTRADALSYLESQPDGSLGAVFSAQFVEHLPTPAYARLIELAAAKLRSGGRLILETQNPECLAIFSQSFYLDPTHVRPVPPQQLRFLMEESGFHDVTIHYMSRATEAGLPELPVSASEDTAWNLAIERFNETYFRYMDYGIVGRKP